MAETNLRQADAFVTVEGIVSEKDLKKEIEDGKTVIKGSVTVKTSDTNFVRFSVYAAEKTKKGTSNPAYSGLETVMDQYKSIAEVGAEEADCVNVRGQLNPYPGRDGREIVGYRANFFNRVKREAYDPKAEFEVELFISSIVPEMVRNGEDIEETNRKIVKGWMPTYNGIEPIELIAPEEDGIADGIGEVFTPNQTARFFGNIINTAIVKTREIPTVLGPKRTDKKTSYKNELIITGAGAPYEEEGGAIEPYNKDTIEAAKQERENRLKENQSHSTTNNRPSAAASGRSTKPLF